MSDSNTQHGGNVSLITSVLGAGFVSGIIPAGVLPANVLNIEHAYNLSHAQVGRLIGLCMVFGGATGGLLGGWICGRIGALKNVLLALTLSAAALGCVGLISHVAATFFGLAGYFFAMGFMGSSNTLASDICSPDEGIFSGTLELAPIHIPYRHDHGQVRLQRIIEEGLLASSNRTVRIVPGFSGSNNGGGKLADIGLTYPLIFGTAVMAAFIIAFFASPIGIDGKEYSSQRGDAECSELSSPTTKSSH